jgi:transposase
VDILNLPGWHVIGCEAGEERYDIHARVASCGSACVACGSLAVVKHGTDAQVVRDLPCHGKYVVIHVDRHRYRCKQCQKTWFEPLPEVDERRQATSRLVRYIQRQALRRTFVALALEVGVDEKTIRNIFHDHITELEQARRIEAPFALGIDELHLLGQPRGMLTDLEANTVLEVLPDRKKLTISQFLSRLPGKERVQVAVIDMWRPYFEALQEQLPQAVVVIDKFHVLKMLSQAVETVRKDIRDSLSDRQRRALMHDRFLLLKRPCDLDEQQRLILESWLGTFPRLKVVYERKEQFYSIYDAATQEEAFERYFIWKCRCSCLVGSPVPKLQQSASLHDPSQQVISQPEGVSALLTMSSTRFHER